MIIAQQKRNENIAEYLLYMWQVEDIIRAYKLDIDLIDRNIISQYNISAERKQQMREWYEGLIIMMRNESVQTSGHLQINKNVIIRLNDLHNQLLNESDRFPQYRAQYYQVLPQIVALRAKTPAEQQCDEIETCFNALYGVILLKLQGKEISKETTQALSGISYFIGLLAAYLKKDEEKPLFGNDEEI